MALLPGLVAVEIAVWLLAGDHNGCAKISIVYGLAIAICIFSLSQPINSC